MSSHQVFYVFTSGILCLHIRYSMSSHQHGCHTEVRETRTGVESLFVGWLVA